MNSGMSVISSLLVAPAIKLVKFGHVIHLDRAGLGKTVRGDQ
jgi:hypothetical protein